MMAKKKVSPPTKRSILYQQATSNQVSQVKAAQFNGLGRAAPIFRVLLMGVDFPVDTLNDLLKKVGGENRVLKIADSSRLTKQLYCVKDILAVIPKLDRHFPYETLEQMVNLIVEIDKKETHNSGLKLNARVDNFHLKKTLNKTMGCGKKKKPEYKLPILSPWDPPYYLGELLPFGLLPPRLP